MHAVLAICGGGNDTVAWAFVAGAILAWIGVAALIIRAGSGIAERVLLASLLIVSVPIGPWIFFANPNGLATNESSRFFLALLLPGVIGTGVALASRKAHGARAFLASSWGALFVTAGFFIVLAAFFGFGSGCPD